MSMDGSSGADSQSEIEGPKDRLQAAFQVRSLLQPNQFQALRKLAMTAPIEFVTTFLKTCKPSLSSFSLTCASVASRKTMQTLLQSLSNVHSHRPLYDFRLTILEPTTIPICEELSELRSFDLHHFELNCGQDQFAPVLSSTIFIWLIRNWRNLQHLLLDVPSSISLESLRTVAQSCPLLQDFHVRQVRGFGRLALPSDHWLPTPSDALRIFSISDHDLPPLPLAKFIGVIWPNARFTSSIDSDAVNDFLEMGAYLRTAQAGKASFTID